MAGSRCASRSDSKPLPALHDFLSCLLATCDSGAPRFSTRLAKRALHSADARRSGVVRYFIGGSRESRASLFCCFVVFFFRSKCVSFSISTPGRVLPSAFFDAFTKRRHDTQLFNPQFLRVFLCFCLYPPALVYIFEPRSTWQRCGINLIDAVKNGDEIRRCASPGEWVARRSPRLEANAGPPALPLIGFAALAAPAHRTPPRDQLLGIKARLTPPAENLRRRPAERRRRRAGGEKKRENTSDSKGESGNTRENAQRNPLLPARDPTWGQR